MPQSTQGELLAKFTFAGATSCSISEHEVFVGLRFQEAATPPMTQNESVVDVHCVAPRCWHVHQVGESKA